MSSFWIFLVALVAGASCYSVSDCPLRWPRDKYLQVRGGYCFRFEVNNLRFHNAAERSCHLAGSTLAMPKTADLQNYLYGELKQTYNVKERAWIGLDDNDSENTFRWADGQLFDRSGYRNFAPGNGPTGSIIGWFKDCSSIDMRKGGQWFETPCGFFTDPKAYICQYKLPESTTTTTRTTTTTPTTSLDCGEFECDENCPDGYVVDPSTNCPICLCIA